MVGARKFLFGKYKKNGFLRKYEKFFRVDFHFWIFGWKVHQVALIYATGSEYEIVCTNWNDLYFEKRLPNWMDLSFALEAPSHFTCITYTPFPRQPPPLYAHLICTPQNLLKMDLQSIKKLLFFKDC